MNQPATEIFRSCPAFASHRIIAVALGSHFKPRSRRIDCSTGSCECPFSASWQPRRREPSTAGTCSARPWCKCRARRSAGMLVGMSAGDAVKSLNRDRLNIRSRLTSIVQQPPTMSSKQASLNESHPAAICIRFESELQLLWTLLSATSDRSHTYFGPC